MKEIETLMELDHPNVVKIYGFGHNGVIEDRSVESGILENLSFISTEFISCVTLREFILQFPRQEPQKRLNEGEAAFFFKQIV